MVPPVKTTSSLLLSGSASLKEGLFSFDADVNVIVAFASPPLIFITSPIAYPWPGLFITTIPTIPSAVKTVVLTVIPVPDPCVVAIPSPET